VEFHIYSVTNQYEICSLHYAIKPARGRIRSRVYRSVFVYITFLQGGIIKRRYVMKSGLPVCLLDETKQHSAQYCLLPCVTVEVWVRCVVVTKARYTYFLQKIFQGLLWAPVESFSSYLRF